MTSREAYELFMTPPPMSPRSRREQELFDRGDPVELHINGQRVLGRTWGQGSPVLVQHGWGSRGTAMWAIVKALESDHQVFAFDAPGHGDSGASRSSMFQFADTIAGASSVFGPFQAIVAHSIGATAVPLAVTRGAQANRFVLISPRNGLTDFLSRFFELTQLDNALHDSVREHWAEEFGWDSVMAATPSLLSKTFEFPALIIHDLDDEDIPMQEAHDIHNAWRESRLLQTSGLGHARIVRSTEVAAQIADFVKGSGNVAT